MPNGRPRGNKPKKTVIAQRLARVYELRSIGYKFTKVRQIVAAEAKKEAENRKKPKEGEPKPPEIWGNSGTIADRTLRRYWKWAGLKLIEHGKELVKAGDMILGKNVSRLDIVFARALEKEKFNVCRLIVADQLKIFGLDQGIHAPLSGADADDIPDITPQTPEPEQAVRTIDQIVDDQFRILNEARKRKGLKPLPNLRLEA